MFSAHDPTACDSAVTPWRPVTTQASRSTISWIRRTRLTPTLYLACTYVNKEDTEAQRYFCNAQRRQTSQIMPLSTRLRVELRHIPCGRRNVENYGTSPRTNSEFQQGRIEGRHQASNAF